VDKRTPLAGLHGGPAAQLPYWALPVPGGLQEGILSTGRFPVRWYGTLAVVTTPAEIDVANEREVGEQLNTLLGKQPSMLVVDLTRTRFCDSAGIAALVSAWRRAEFLGVPFRVAAPSEPVLRVLRVLGVNSLMDIFPSLGAAVADEARDG